MNPFSQHQIMTVEATSQLIESGRVLVIAGDPSLFATLPKGNWIGGTTAYFMDHTGGQVNQTNLFVTDFTDVLTDFYMVAYDETEILTKMLDDRYENGFSFVLLPGFSSILQTYALESRNADTLFDRPVVGWVTGGHFDEVGEHPSTTWLGTTGTVYSNHGVVLHGKLADSYYAQIDIVNIFQQNIGDVFSFEEDAFSFKECLINGERKNLAAYYKEQQIDTRLPLVADYAGTSINSSLLGIQEEGQQVDFYAPLLRGVEYRLAQPMNDWYATFTKALPKETTGLAFSCNCILNYVYLDMQDKYSGKFVGPFTFGEIAYILVNQTMVTLSIHAH